MLTELYQLYSIKTRKRHIFHDDIIKKDSTLRCYYAAIDDYKEKEQEILRQIRNRLENK